MAATPGWSPTPLPRLTSRGMVLQSHHDRSAQSRRDLHSERRSLSIRGWREDDLGRTRALRGATTITSCGSIRRIPPAWFSEPTREPRSASTAATTWSSWYNQPTAQLYHVTTDNQFPYVVYGAQQDSGSGRGSEPHRPRANYAAGLVPSAAAERKRISGGRSERP